MVDVAIIGGGPAGSTVATLLKKRHPEKRIVVFEKERFPRHHVGESTLPDMNPILHKLGVLEKIERAGFVKKTGITYRWRVDRPMFSEVFARGVLKALGGGVEVPDHSWQIDRSRYDQILLEHARAHGVEVIEQRAEVTLHDDVFAVNQLRAGHVVDCSGQARVLSRQLRLEKQAHALGDLALYRYYRGMKWSAPVGTPDSSKIFFSATPSGWIWFIPLSESEVSVGLVTKSECLREGLFDDELATVPEMVEMLADARPMAAPGSSEPPRTLTVADWSYSHARPCGPGYYLCGDAAAFVDPILSSGILLAHHSGLMAANAITTEWQHPEIARDELHDAYAQFYSDLYRGFLVMAEWWYRKRKVEGIDQWLRRASTLAPRLGGDDVRAFMTFAAGYLTDFRFVNLGIAFGDEGFQQCLDGLEVGSEIARQLDLSRICRRNFARASLEPYLATDVDSDRWRRLPALRFDDKLYRPPIKDHDDIPRALSIIERLTEACDGRHTVEQAIRRVAASLGDDSFRFANVVLIDLIALEVLR